MRHKWTDPEMEETIDIYLNNAPGSPQERESGRLVAKINLDASSPVGPDIRQHIKAVEHAIRGDLTTKPKPSRGLLRLVNARRAAGRLTRKW